MMHACVHACMSMCACMCLSLHVAFPEHHMDVPSLTPTKGTRCPASNLASVMYMTAKPQCVWRESRRVVLEEEEAVCVMKEGGKGGV